MPEFDIAWTYEHFGQSVVSPQLVVSQKFRQACLKHGFEAEFQPVRVESEPPDEEAEFAVLPEYLRPYARRC